MKLRLAICICTADRPEVLDRCLASIAAGTSLPDSVLVSDDSQEPEDTSSVCAKYPHVRYLSGPRRGLCANRNAVLRPVQDEFISLVDDDALVSSTFVEQLRDLLPILAPRTIVTGDVLEYGGRTTPRNPSFWGHFTVPPGTELRTINLNCNCFPIDAFRLASFDENLVYGYEDMDLCSSLIAKGFSIFYDRSLINEHRPPERSRIADRRRIQLAEQARFQTSMRRHLVWERNFGRALLYAVLAPVHRILHALKERDPQDIPRAMRDILLACKQALSYK